MRTDNLRKSLLALAALATLFALPACEQDEDDPQFAPETLPETPVFTNGLSAVYRVLSWTPESVAERFTWETPALEDTSSVQYELQASTAGAETGFATVGASTTLRNKALTMADLKGFADALGLDTDDNAFGTVFLRVRATSGGEEAVSEATPITIELVRPRLGMGVTLTSNETFVTGTEETTFEITVQSEAGLGQVTASGSGPTETGTAGVISDGEFGTENSQTFTYTVSFDDPEVMEDTPYEFSFTFTDGQGFEVSSEAITVTVQPVPSQPDPWYVVGAATPGHWSWDNGAATTAAQVEEGVYQATLSLTVEAFRFFSGAYGDWESGGVKRNYPHFADAGYTIDARFEDAMDGDNNFRFTGTPGYYTLTVNTNDQTITLEDATPPDQLYLIGAAIVGTNWSWDNPTELPETATEGVYSGQVELANDAFRIFTDTGTQWSSDNMLGFRTNFPGFFDNGYAIDGNFEDAMDGDNNFRFVGTPGVYTMTVNTINRTITLE